MPQRPSARLRSAAALAALLGTMCVTPPAPAAIPKASRAFYNVATSAGHGTTSDCALSFITGWTDAGGHNFAAAGTVSLSAAGGHALKSTLKVRANMDKTRRTISFAWMDVHGAGDTRGFSAPEPDQRGPFFSYSLSPDPKGRTRLRAAAEQGFVLTLRIIGLTHESQVRLPAAPKDTVSQLAKCMAQVNGGM